MTTTKPLMIMIMSAKSTMTIVMITMMIMTALRKITIMPAMITIMSIMSKATGPKRRTNLKHQMSRKTNLQETFQTICLLKTTAVSV